MKYIGGIKLGIFTLVLAGVFALLVNSSVTRAINPLPTPQPVPGAYGLEATKRQPPPKDPATIAVPGNGAQYTDPIHTVQGICTSELLVEVYNNGALAGSGMCVNGHYSIQITLYPGDNELVAIIFDSLEQAGPESNHVTVRYNDLNLKPFSQSLSLTSQYGRRSTQLGNPLQWPLQLVGGTGPYAFSIDWGDGGKPELKSQAFSGNLTITHDYKKAGIYTINITVTDSNGLTAFLQVVTVISGAPDPASATQQAKKTLDPTTVGKARIMWIPTLLLLILLLPTYWLGRRSMLVTIRRKMLSERDAYQQK